MHPIKTILINIKNFIVSITCSQALLPRENSGPRGPITLRFFETKFDHFEAKNLIQFLGWFLSV